MADLISCYESLQMQIQKLSINENQERENNDLIFNIDKIKAILGINIQRTCLKDKIFSQIVQNNIIQYNAIYDSNDMIFPYIQIFYKIRFDISCHQISIYSSLLRNYIPLQIQQKSQILILNKLFIKVNSSLKYGSFRINPITGQISLCFCSLLTESQFNSLLLEPIRITEYLNDQIIKEKYYWRTYVGKILQLINEVPSNYHREPKLNHIKVKQLNEGIAHFGVLLNKISIYLHLQFPFMYSQHTHIGNKSIVPEQILKMSDTIKSVKQTRKILNPNIFNILKKLTSNSINLDPSKLTKMSEEQKKQMISMLLPPVIRFPKGQPSQIYSQISIIQHFQQYEWETIDQGGFGKISKGVVKFKFMSPQNQIHTQFEQIQPLTFTRTLIKKQDFYSNLSKIPHQKAILSKMNPHSNPFICKFYHSNQPEYKQYLFAEYCPHRSLASFKNRVKSFITLSSKLLMLRYIAQGIKFLKDNKIQHLDLKPMNILMTPGIVKLIDFGQSHHPGVCDKNYRPGTSIPYAPPESFLFQLYNNSPYLDRLDIYSFGVIAYELLYNSYPNSYQKMNYEILRKKYIQKNFNFRIPPQKIFRSGYEYISRWLLYICIKCMEKDEKKRPCIQWIIIFLNYCISMQQYIYL